MIVFNFSLFMLIAVGQALIYYSIKVNTVKNAGQRSTGGRDMAVAKRLLAVVMTDFACWFPVGVIGILARYVHSEKKNPA